MSASPNSWEKVLENVASMYIFSLHGMKYGLKENFIVSILRSFGAGRNWAVTGEMLPFRDLLGVAEDSVTLEGSFCILWHSKLI